MFSVNADRCEALPALPHAPPHRSRTEHQPHERNKSEGRGTERVSSRRPGRSSRVAAVRTRGAVIFYQCKEESGEVVAARRFYSHALKINNIRTRARACRFSLKTDSITAHVCRCKHHLCRACCTHRQHSAGIGSNIKNGFICGTQIHLGKRVTGARAVDSAGIRNRNSLRGRLRANAHQTEIKTGFGCYSQ